MKTRVKNLFFLSALIAGLEVTLTDRATAQTLKTLHSFTAALAPSFTNCDGFNPAGLVLSGNTLYGTTVQGGMSNAGTVFAVNTDGTGFKTLHSFSGPDGVNPNPTAGLILSGSTLYGTAAGGGSSGKGTVFAVKTNGTGFTNLYSFTGSSDGANPNGGLIVTNNTLYGTTPYGGSSGYGTLLAVNTEGTGFTNLHSFADGSDGAVPRGGLALSGSALFGTAIGGGSSGNGTVFAVNTDGTGFTNLHSFTAVLGPLYTNSDGEYPVGGLVLSGSNLFGTAAFGGNSGNGTMFALNTDGTGFTNLHVFTAGSGYYPNVTNSDGANPNAGLTLSGNTLYGTASDGGVSGNGIVFAINADGTGFTNLYIFTPTSGPSSTNSDGAHPDAGLILSGNTLYGTAVRGGSAGNGTVFSLSFAPQLTILHSGVSVILNWPTNTAGFDYAGYALQSTTNLVSPVWTNVFPGPVVVNGQNTVTNPTSGAWKFYRLSQ